MLPFFAFHEFSPKTLIYGPSLSLKVILSEAKWHFRWRWPFFLCFFFSMSVFRESNSYSQTLPLPTHFTNFPLFDLFSITGFSNLSVMRSH